MCGSVHVLKHSALICDEIDSVRVIVTPSGTNSHYSKKHQDGTTVGIKYTVTFKTCYFASYASSAVRNESLPRSKPDCAFPHASEAIGAAACIERTPLSPFHAIM
jgi:hypothetical protein